MAHAARNAFEFKAEGSDWRRAIEEPAFYEGADGVLVHPATWLRFLAIYKRMNDARMKGYYDQDQENLHPGFDEDTLPLYHNKVGREERNGESLFGRVRNLITSMGQQNEPASPQIVPRAILSQ
jgi:hypothetical protein